MSFIIKATTLFYRQIEELSDESIKLVNQKLMLVKINPYRFKRIRGFNLFLFRIRFQDNRKEKRVIYLVDKPFVIVICIIDRNKEYKDLKQYLKKLGY